jgi:hypothetical protein
MKNERRDSALAQYLVSDAADHRARNTAAAVSSDCDEVCVVRRREAKNGRRDVGCDNDGGVDRHPVFCERYLQTGKVALRFVDVASPRRTNQRVHFSYGDVLFGGDDTQ